MKSDIMKRFSAFHIALILVCLIFTACQTGGEIADAKSDILPESSMPLQFATQFSVDNYAGGYKLISMTEGERFLVIPEGGETPSDIAEDIILIQQPVNNIYLAATSAMSLFDALESVDAISLSGTKQSGWYIENVCRAMENGDILYAGKYSEPDYELLLQSGCPLAIESMMISHASEVKDKLEELGIAVLIDRSSAEAHPLGRTEWIKLYGALLNKEEQAKAIFDEQVKYQSQALDNKSGGQTVAFFHINSSGQFVVRSGSDYIAEMLKIAGGSYLFDDLSAKGSTVTVEVERFFAAAKDADCLIYNSTIGGEIDDLEQLISQNELFEDFKAVRNKNVWCTTEDMFQQTTQIGRMIESFEKIFSGSADSLNELPFLYRLR